MPVPLLDDGVSVTYQLDDGSTVKVAKDAAMRIGAPLPPSGPPPVAPTLPGGPGAAPSIIPSPAQSASPVSAAPPPLVPPPVVDTFAGAPGAPAPQPASPPPPPRELGNAGAAIGGGAAGAPAPGMPARKPAPTTDQMHAAGNFGDVTGGINDAYAGLQQANNDHAVVQQAAAMRTANELEHNAAQIAAQDALIQKQKTEALAEVQRKGSAVQAAVDDWAKTSIDPNRAWKSLSGAGKAGLIFSQLIAGLGSALKHQGDKNPAVDMWLHQVDQDIRLQMDARDQKREAIGYAKDALSAFKDIANSKNELLLLGKAAMIEQGQRRLEIINAQTKSAEVKANTEAANAQLGLAKQQTLGEWAKTAFSSEMQKRQQANADRQTAIAGGHLALANKEFKEGIRRYDLDSAQKERFHKDELAEKYAAFRAKGDEKSAKLAEQQSKEGVYDPTTGKAMLQPEGEKMMRDADTLEKAARTAKDPALAAQYTQRAKDLRDQAEIEHGFKTPQAEKVKESIGHAQDLVDKVADIKRTLGTDPSSVDRETWAKLGSEFEQAKAAWIESVGAKVSSREMDAISDMFGHSPEDLSTRVLGRGKLGATLDAISEGTIKTTQAKIRAQGYRGTWRAQPPQTQEVEGIKGQTSVERGEAAKPGVIARAERSVLNPLGYARGGSFDPETRAEEGGDVTPTGLTAEDTATVAKLAKQYASGNDEQRAKILDQTTSYALSPRVPIASGVVQLIKGENPELYQAIVKNLPPDRKQDLGILDIPPRAVKR